MKGNRLTIAVMFGMVFMVGFVTMFTGPLAAVVKAQFGASNALSQFGSSANFLAYLFMGIPCGMVLKRKGYRFTSLAAVSVGILGVALQILAGFVASFGVYVTGAFVAGLSMCMLNVTANPMMNTLGGGGNGGNRLVQYGCTFNSVGGMSSPLILGFLIGNEVAKANVLDALPVQAAALLFFAFGFVVMENGATVSVEASWALNIADPREAITLICGDKGGADMLAVASVAEGTMLRRQGITAPILVLGAVTAEDVREGADHSLIQTVCSPQMVALCEEAASGLGKQTEVHLKIDTGMGRIGIRTEAELKTVTDALERSPHVRLCGAFTHFSDADDGTEGMEYTEAQYCRFVEMTDRLPRDIVRHCSNSAAIHRRPDFAMDMVRAGISLYGYPPVPERNLGLEPCMRWTAKISYIKDLPAGAYRE